MIQSCPNSTFRKGIAPQFSPFPSEVAEALQNMTGQLQSAGPCVYGTSVCFSVVLSLMKGFTKGEVEGNCSLFMKVSVAVTE